MLDENYQPIWIEDENRESISSITKFFGITTNMMAHIFCPGEQTPSRFRGNVLMNNAKPEDVAKNILDLIDAVKFHVKLTRNKTLLN